MKGIQIALLVQKWRQFYWMGGICLLVELYWEGSTHASLFYYLLEESLKWFLTDGSFSSKSCCRCNRVFEVEQVSPLSLNMYVYAHKIVHTKLFVLNCVYLMMHTKLCALNNAHLKLHTKLWTHFFLLLFFYFFLHKYIYIFFLAKWCS